MTIDLSPVFEGQLKSAERTFVKESPASLLIKDRLELSEETKLVTWQLITTADVEIVKGGVILIQDGKKLKLENLSHPDFTVSIVSLYPALLKLDRQIEGLKRIDLRIPAWTFEREKGEIRVRLSEY